MAIRMLSIDAPEVHYPGNTNPARHDENLQQLATWITEGKAPIDDDLAAILQPKLATGLAGSLQKQQGLDASDAFTTIIKSKLKKPSGRHRSVFLLTANSPFDSYGRLLAYMAPKYTSQELSQMSFLDRATFNLMIVQAGWAATFIIYPNLSKYRDLVLFHKIAREAVEQEKGIWANPLTLTGYEFRSCYRLFVITDRLQKGRVLSERERGAWITRYCCDMTTREIFEPQQYHRVEPYNRIFVEPKDANDAVGRISLIPGG
jgi:endonuclease YncB( thermonuclease family)